MAPSSYHVMSNKIENYLFKHSIIFRHTYKPHWQSCEIMIFFCKYDIFIWYFWYDIFLKYLFQIYWQAPSCSLQYQSFMRNQERKIGLQKKVHRRICAKDITFLTASPPLFYVISCCFLRFLSPVSKWRTCWMAPIKIHDNAVIFCVMIPWANGRKYGNLLQVDTSCWHLKEHDIF